KKEIRIFLYTHSAFSKLYELGVTVVTDCTKFVIFQKHNTVTTQFRVVTGWGAWAAWVLVVSAYS
ncbi:hypothetical protein ACJ2L7_004685, partial [Salmonella enterica subsp. enterica serovar Newport]